MTIIYPDQPVGLPLRGAVNEKLPLSSSRRLPKGADRMTAIWKLVRQRRIALTREEFSLVLSFDDQKKVQQEKDERFVSKKIEVVKI
ncbi:MAG: hypothetical protein COB85_02765 [Bacteroidetes bacterium]|nr:MAG: hypothetical protein COB85_02765 [Bacteroidota bacterium]